jgi:1-acyl-sn-glycerol-3-phosphate acyltransferase
MKTAKLYLRSLIANLYFYPALTIGLTLSVIVGLVYRKKMPYVWDNYIIPPILKGVFKLSGMELEVRGTEYMSPDVIYASKHESALETYVLPSVIPNSVFVLKKELTYVPIFGWAQALYGMIPVDRGAGGKVMRGLLKAVKQRIDEGRSLVIFPEGTRCKHLEVKGYKSGVLFIADSLDKPVVPVALNTGLRWAKASFLRKPGKVIFEFLPPIRVSDYKNKKEFLEELENRIETACAKMD